MQNNRSHNRRRLFTTFCCMVLCMALGTGCRALLIHNTSSLIDDSSGCTIENPLPPIYRYVSFTGSCDSNGMATGHGKAILYFSNDNPAMEYEGPFVRGMMHGEGTAFVHDGSYTIEGQWRNGYPVACTASVYPPVLIENPVSELSYEQLDMEPPVFNLAEIQSHLVYPPRANLDGQSGKVLLRALVSIDGQIVKARVITEASDPEFILSAFNAVFQSGATVEPATANGVTIPMWVTIPIYYKMR